MESAPPLCPSGTSLVSPYVLAVASSNHDRQPMAPRPQRRPMAQCSAHRTNGEPCQAWAMQGQTVCVTHGGAAKQNRAAAARRLEEQQAMDAVRTYGLPIDIAPDEALLQEVHRTAGHVAWLSSLVGEGNKDDLTQWAIYNSGDDQTVTRRPSVWVELYQKERAHLVAVCKAAIGAGIAERQVRLAERQGELVGELLRVAIDAAGLSVEQQHAAYGAIRGHLTRVA